MSESNKGFVVEESKEKATREEEIVVSKATMTTTAHDGNANGGGVETKTTATDSIKRKRTETSHADGESLENKGCYCHGDDCLSHTCQCFIKGKVCNPSSCNCCADTTTTTCDNNDDNIEQRKRKLLRIAQEHPELLWSNVDHQKGSVNNIKDDTQETIQTTYPAASTTTTTTTDVVDDTANQHTMDPNQVPMKIWKEIEKVILETSRKKRTESTNDVDDYADVQMKDIVEKEKDYDSKKKSSKDLALKVAQSTSRDMEQIMKSIMETQKQQQEAKDQLRESMERSKQQQEQKPEIFSVLHCDEEFSSDSESIGEQPNRPSSSLSISQTESPDVQRLLCQEQGLFNGDDPTPIIVDENVSLLRDSKTASLAAQRLAIIQETTKLVRFKTLALTKRRLQVEEKRS